jgi:hypothetical protein
MYHIIKVIDIHTLIATQVMKLIDLMIIEDTSARLRAVTLRIQDSN